MKSKTNQNTIPARRSPGLTSSCQLDEESECMVGVTNMYAEQTSGLHMKTCKVVLEDINPKSVNPSHKRCLSKRCKTCPQFVESNCFTSSFTGKDYVSIGSTFSCITKNIVYPITCNQCGYQYVGETECSLRDRINGHRSSIKSGKNTYMAQHFNSKEIGRAHV